MAINETIERIVFQGVDKITGVSKQAQTAVGGLRRSLDDVKGALAGIGATVGAGAMVALYKETLNVIAALDDMAEQTGASVEQLSAIQRVAKVGGHDFEGLTGQIGKMVKGLRDGNDEGSRTVRALDLIGVKARDLDGRFRDTGEILVEVAQKLAHYRDSGAKVALVQDILGKGAERYLPLLKEIAEGTDLHSTVTAKQAQQAEEADKNIRRLMLTMEDARKELVNQYTPAIVEWTDKLLAATRAQGSFAGGLALMAMQPLGQDIGERLKANQDVIDRNEAALGRPKNPLTVFDVGGRMVGTKLMAAYRERDYLLSVQRQEALKLGGPGSLDARDLRMRRPATEEAPSVPNTGTITPEQIAKQWEENREEQAKTNAEAAALTDAFRANERDQRRRFQALDLQETDDFYQVGGAMLIKDADEKNRIKIENFDREEAEEIARGEQRVAADGLSFSLRIEMLRQSLLTGEQAENESFARRLEELEAYSDDELELIGGRQAIKEKMEAEHQKRVNSLSNRGNRQIFDFVDAAREGDIQSATGHFASLTAGFAQHSRKMFELNKLAAIADATVSMAQGISKSLSAYPMPWAAIAAAAHAGLFMLQIQAIRSARFGGGGTAPSVAASAPPAMPVTPVGGSSSQQAEPITTIINWQPGGRRLMTMEDVQELFDLMNEGARKGGRLDRTILRRS